MCLSSPQMWELANVYSASTFLSGLNFIRPNLFNIGIGAVQIIIIQPFATSYQRFFVHSINRLRPYVREPLDSAILSIERGSTYTFSTRKLKRWCPGWYRWHTIYHLRQLHYTHQEVSRRYEAGGDFSKLQNCWRGHLGILPSNIRGDDRFFWACVQDFQE